MEKVNVAFIGAGPAAHAYHFSSLSRMDDVRIVAIAELDEARLQKAAEQYGVPGRYTDYHEMLEKEDIDAVYVVVRPMVLKPIVLDVIAAGKHLFTEKPAGVTSAETVEMAAAAEAAGIKSAVGCNRRYCHVLRKAKELVLECGPISEMMAEFHKNMEQSYFGISILHCDGLHVIDAMRDVMGEPQEVHSHADRWYGEKGWEGTYNCFRALIRFESGAGGLFTANRKAGSRYERFEIHGHNISAYIRAPERLEVYRSDKKEPEIYTGEQLAGSNEMVMTYGYFVENREFIDCIKNDTVPLTNLSDNVKTMQLCDMIYNGSHLERD